MNGKKNGMIKCFRLLDSRVSFGYSFMHHVTWRFLACFSTRPIDLPDLSTISSPSAVFEFYFPSPGNELEINRGGHRHLTTTWSCGRFSKNVDTYKLYTLHGRYYDCCHDLMTIILKRIIFSFPLVFFPPFSQTPLYFHPGHIVVVYSRDSQWITPHFNELFEQRDGKIFRTTWWCRLLVSMNHSYERSYNIRIN